MPISPTTNSIRSCFEAVTEPAPHPSPETPFLRDMFRSLNTASIPYCVLRDYHHLPDDTRGHDIDLLVPSACLGQAVALIRQAACRHNGRLIASYQRSARILRFCGKHSQWWGVALDIFPCFEYSGLTFYDTSSILDRSVSWNNIPVACAADAYVTAFLKEILANSKDRKNYAQLAAEHYRRAPGHFDRMFRKYFGNQLTRRLARFFQQGADPQNIPALARCARKALYRNLFCRHPLCTLKNFLKCYAQRFTRIFQPPGISVVFLGTDGAGKSTLIENIRPVLARALHDEVVYQHLRPNLLPSLARLFSRPTPTGPTTDPHAHPPSGFLISLLRITYYQLDYIFGYFLKVFPALVKRPCVWIFDRYFYDYFFDPRRSLIALPSWLIRLYSFLVPQPDIIFCLGTDPEIIHKRKPELPLEEISRQVAKLRKLCYHKPNAIWIDTHCNLQDTVDHTLEAIITSMAAKYSGEL